MRSDETPGDDDPRLGFVVVRIAEAVDRRFLGALAELGLTARKLRVLVLLGRSPGSSQRELAGNLGVDAANLVEVLDAMDEDGLLLRARDPDDRRRHRLDLTARGTTLLERANAATAGIDEAIFAPLGATRASFEAAARNVWRELDRA